jgi:3-oxoacyl-[acyl-carrier protein] reductase
VLQRFNKIDGWVINISSLAGKNPFAGGAAYKSSKFGLNGFTEAMMLDHRDNNVAPESHHPGAAWTQDWEGGGRRAQSELEDALRISRKF